MVSDFVQAEWIPRLEQEVRRYLNRESSGHDPWHAFRVRDLQFASQQQLERISTWYRLPRCYMTSAMYPGERSTRRGERV